MTEKTYSAFEELNLNDARMENETREEYKLRLKTNKKILKLYSKFGREAFQELFPDGIRYDMFNKPKVENNPVVIDGHTIEGAELEKDNPKDFIEKMQKATEKLGEAK